jgi:eukaryotic-like serine/threonine-protein kinase
VIGETIGSYKILSQLGAGAMGEVYLAEHRHLKRKAAVKLLAPEIVGRPDLLERFFLEARATSAIDHPGIVQVFDCEVDATGRPYIVMEYLDGETLAAVLARRGALPATTVARLARGMAEALEAAHAKGIVHRDIKPENIFVQAQPPDSVKLVDFGIAKLAGDFRAGQVHQTRNGAMMGTPLYMSPEQCRDSGKIDFRTDLYSLGCVVFEMLTARPPFTQEALGDLVVAHLTEEPKDVRTLNPAVPKALAELTAQLLRKDPAQRPANMRVVADRLAAFIGGLTTVPDGPPAAAVATPAKKQTTFGDSAAELVSTGEAVAQTGRRAPLFLGLGAVAVGLVVAGVVLRRPQATADAPSAAAAPVQAAAGVAPAARAATGGTPQLPWMVGEASGPNKRSPAPRTPAKPASGQASASPVEKAQPQPHPKRPEGRRLAVADAESERHGNPAADTPNQVPPTAAAEAARPPDFLGVWEGPWTDAVRHQSGRLYLQIGGNGGVTGWFSNAAVRQSFRLNGRMASPGELTLACACPPRQDFGARVLVHEAGGGEIRGQLTLSGATGVFGQSHLVLRRAAAR